MSRKDYFREYRRLHGEDINAKRRKNYRKKVEQGQRPLFDEEFAVHCCRISGPPCIEDNAGCRPKSEPTSFHISPALKH